MARCRRDAPRDPCDMAKAGLPEVQSPDDAKYHPSEMTSETGAALCLGFTAWSRQPPERWAMPNEGIQGDEWDAYVALTRTTGTNAGSPTGKAYGDGAPIVVAGVTTCQGERESRSQGEGAQVMDTRNREVCEMQNAETVLSEVISASCR